MARAGVTATAMGNGKCDGDGNATANAGVTATSTAMGNGKCDDDGNGTANANANANANVRLEIPGS